ncbi:SnoaL domain-containing protein [Trichoderma evansii]
MQSSQEQTLQDRNKYLVARYNHEVWIKGNLDIIDEVCSDDFVSDTPVFGRHCGRSAVKKMLLEIKETFAGVSLHPFGPVPMVAVHNYVVTRFIGGGLQTRIGFQDALMQELPRTSTENTGSLSGTAVYRIKHDKIVEEFGEMGALSSLLRLSSVGIQRSNKDTTAQ